MATDKQEYVEREVRTDHIQLEKFVEEIRAAATGLHNPHVEANVEESRFANTVRFAVTGVRDLTAEEIQARKEEEKARRSLIEERERAQLEILTKRYGAPHVDSD